LSKFLEDVTKWQDLASKIKLNDFVKTILEDSGYLQMCMNDKTPEGNSKVENIKEFISSLEEFSSLENFLEHVSLVASNDNNLTNKDMVNVMTVHSAKGLEFDTVFIPGLEEGIFPSSRSIEERNGLEEERRLFYVAITRAKRSLKLSYAKNRVIFGSFQSCLASQFLAELPEDMIEKKSIEDFYYEDFTSRNSKRQDSNVFEINDNFLKERIFHQKFGYGKVISTNGDKLEIIFEKAGTKTVIKKFVTKVS
jgi:DNA helicase-2/ATP-dependent DNA helicase PcrA